VSQGDERPSIELGHCSEMIWKADPLWEGMGPSSFLKGLGDEVAIRWSAFFLTDVVLEYRQKLI
jgi:hypothetical protein